MTERIMLCDHQEFTVQFVVLPTKIFDITQIGYAVVTMKSHNTFESRFRKPKNSIDFGEKRILIYLVHAEIAMLFALVIQGEVRRKQKKDHGNAAKNST